MTRYLSLLYFSHVEISYSSKRALYFINYLCFFLYIPSCEAHKQFGELFENCPGENWATLLSLRSTDWKSTLNHLTSFNGENSGGGEKGAGGVREAGVEGRGGGRGKQEKRRKLGNIAEHFAIKKAQRGGANRYRAGTGSKGEAGSLNPAVPSHPNRTGRPTQYLAGNSADCA